MAAAMQILAVAEAIIGNLGGHEAVAAGMGVSWPDPTGEMAVLANVPHLMWQAMAAGQLNEAAAAIQATAEAFETLKAATPTPMEIGENQSENVFLNGHNFMGFLTPAIAVNRTNYGRMWVTAADNKYSYAAASAAGVQSIPPLPPPPPSTAGGASMPSPASMANSKEADPLSSGAGGMGTMMSTFGQFASMPEQLMSSNPLSSMNPSSLMSPFQSMLSSMGSGGLGGNPADALTAATTADWLSGTPAAGGSVGANMVSGGGAGGLGALRGPVGWASGPTVNAAAPGGGPEAATISRLSEARAAGAAGSGSGMGGSGGMMGPMMHGKDEQEKSEAKRKSPLTSLAELYRAPDGVPVITGSGGAVFRREEVGSSA